MEYVYFPSSLGEFPKDSKAKILPIRRSRPPPAKNLLSHLETTRESTVTLPLGKHFQFQSLKVF